MRFNWNAIIAAVGYLTDEPDADGPLSGKGYTVTRTGANSFTVDIEQVEFNEGDATNPASPENPNPGPQSNATAESPTSVPTGASESTGEATDKPAPVVEASGATTDTVDTGQGSAVTENVSTGQGAPDTGAVATGQ